MTERAKLELTGSSRRLWRRLAAVQVAILVFGLALPSGVLLAGASPTGATIASDKADYTPGETVTLTGTGWSPGEAVAIVVNDTIGQTWKHAATVMAGDGGDIVDVFALADYFISDYDVKATGAISGSATTTFTDMSIGTYDQCSNDDGDGYASGNTGCRWINGNLNGNNSTYPEGDATVQRLWLEDFAPGSSHSVTFQYGTTKGGKHAYDYLTTWSFSENWIALADRCEDIAGCTTAAENTLAIPDDPNVPAAIETAGQLFTMRGGTMTATTSPTIVSGSYAGDSETAITITFTVGPSSGSMCTTKGQTTTCGIALWFGAHIARSDLWTAFNGTTGAGSVPGSPYHVSLDKVDGASAGERDNQMQASAVVAPPILHLRKVVINNDGGTATVADFPLTANGTGANDLTGTSPVDSGITLVADTWALSETGPGGYSASAWVCVGGSQSGSNITLASGQEATCTITNTDNAPRLKLVKVVTNNDGGTAVPNDWTLSAAAASPNNGRNFNNLGGSGSFQTVFAGSQYTLTENPNPGTGYSTTGIWSCSGGTFSSPDTISVPLGTDVTCTITNTDNPATLKLVKSVTNNDGGTAVPNDWSLAAAAAAPNDGRNFNNLGGSGTFTNVFGGIAYTLTENPNPGTGYSTTGIWSCDGGTFTSPDTISVPLGTDVTCTITNTDNTPRLKLVKSVTNNDGGTKVADDWSLAAAAAAPNDGRNFNNLGGSGTFTNVFGGIAYTLTENPNPGTGYSTTGIWSCDGGTFTSPDTISVPLGTDVTCTITNTDNTPRLKLVKSVTNNDGGTKVADDWSLAAAAAAPNDGRNFNNLGGSGTFTNVFGGIAYTLTENPNPGTGYSTTGIWSCDGGTFTSPDTISVPLGTDVTCTITNTDNTPRLKLVKSVTNNDGGTKVADDWSLAAAAAAPNDGRNFNNLGGSGTFTNVFGGIAYTLTENPNPGTGYSTTGIWSCDGGTFTSPDTISVPLGTDVTCTITNTDNTPRLKLVKSVTNNDGGTKVADDWSLAAAAAAPNDGRNFNNLGGSGTFTNVFGGIAYTLTENPNPGTGYSTTGIWSCDGGTFTSPDTISVPLGTDVTCTITNTDNTPRLKLVKSVTNNDGGTKVADDWSLAAAAAAPNDGRNFNNLGGSGTFTNVFGGIAYTLTENPNPGTGYSTTGIWSCDGGTFTSPDTISVPLGTDVTCTITNTDNTPRLKLVKSVTNNDGGTKVADDWSLAAAAAAPNDGRNFNNLGGSGVFQNVFAGAAYTLAESPNPGTGYSSTGQWSCDGGTMSAGNTVVTVALGDQVTCTITNDDLPGTIIIKKVTKPAGSTTSFNFDANGTGYVGFSLMDQQTNTQTLPAGNYSVTELVPLGWILTGIGGSSDPNTPFACTVTGSGGSTGLGNLVSMTATISLKNGDTVTCVFENTGQGVTRTQGFWATHPQLAAIAWFGGSGYGHTFAGVALTPGIGDTLLCGRNIDTLPKLMGAFWSDISKTTTGAKRSNIDQARMQLLQQLIAAELNVSAFGTVPASGSIAAWEAAYCGTNLNAIKTAQQQAASFNTSGDGGLFTPGTSADSKTARAIADKAFWDVLP